MAYDTTKVPVSSSQDGIRRLLQRHGAERFSFAEGAREGKAWVGVEFIHAGHMVRMTVALKLPSEAALRERVDRARTRSEREIRADAGEQEARRVWRVIHWSIKARLEAVEEGIEVFEQAFLAHLVDPASGATLWEFLAGPIGDGALRVDGPGLAALYQRALPAGRLP